ncbi:MFS transporter [Granulosicoccaceae sp. 1_MG-2023]|nr:MFS transporter [Granulosicoccaceae sp. 1_MG-2023]
MPAFSPTFRAMRVRNYRLWAAGALISNIGTWMQRTAQDWLVLTELTRHNAGAVGIVMALQFGPQLLLLPWTGTATDRFDRRKLMIITQTVMGLLALGLGLLTISGHVTLWQVYTFAFAFGCASALDIPVRQTFVSDLLSDRDLPNGIALNSTSFNSARMIGPAVAGLLIAAVGTGWAFIINGLSYVAVLASLLLMRPSEMQPGAIAQKTRGGFRDGLRYVRERGDLLAMLLMLSLIGTFGMNFPIYISTMSAKVFATDARGYGILSSFVAIGTVLGALLAARRQNPGIATLRGGALFFGIGCAAAALAPGYYWFAAALVLIGIAGMTVMNTSNSLMQLGTERAMRGRVMALRMAVVMGGTPIGAPIVGWIADSYGPRQALGVGAAAGFAAALVALLYCRRVSARSGQLSHNASGAAQS